VRIRFGTVDPDGGERSPLLAPFAQEFPEQVHALARMRQKQMMTGPPEGAEAHVRVKLRDGSNMVERRDRVLLAVDQKRRNGRNRRQDPVDLVIQETVLQSRGQRLEGEFVTVDQ